MVKSRRRNNPDDTKQCSGDAAIRRTLARGAAVIRFAYGVGDYKLPLLMEEIKAERIPVAKIDINPDTSILIYINAESGEVEKSSVDAIVAAHDPNVLTDAEKSENERNSGKDALMQLSLVQVEQQEITELALTVANILRMLQVHG